MPELPEVEVVRRGLEKHLVGLHFTEVEVLDSRPLRRHCLLYTSDAADEL